MAVITSLILGAIIYFSLYIKSVLVGVPHNQLLLIELGSIVIFSAVFAAIAKKIRQPPILAYVISGFLIGPAVFGLVTDIEIIKSFSEIGLAFLLFLAGLEISFKKLKEANLRKIFFVGLFQVGIILLLSLFLADFLHLSTRQAAYVGMAVAFSSTMVVVKILSDRKELVTMHGRISLGILLVQDLIAIFAIIFLTADNISVSVLFNSIMKLVVLLVVAFILQKLVLQKMFHSAANSENSKELLLLYSLAVLFLFIILCLVLEVSIVIGAFIGGVSLANLSFKAELESRISPLRDFFSILFFVALGMQIVFSGILQEIKIIVFLLVVSLFFKPFITMLALRISGYRSRTCFISSLALFQMSEFSIILGMIGLSLGIISQSVLSALVLVTIITMSLTVFFVQHENGLFKFFKKPLNLLKFLPLKENLDYTDKEKKTTLLLGCDRMGTIVLRDLLKEGKKGIVVIDLNPEVISKLRRKKISCMYGDIKSPDILDHLNLQYLTRVISTIPDLEDGLILLEKIKKLNPNTRIILTAQTSEEALELYAKGADYVMLPRFTAGEVVSTIVKKDDASLKSIKDGQITRIKESKDILK